MTDQIICNVCPHACRLRPGDIGACGARGYFSKDSHATGGTASVSLYPSVYERFRSDNVYNGRSIPVGYGIATSIALDPIEKKPLARYYPGSRIISYGSFGCNLKCPFCQNHDISMTTVRQYRPEDMNRNYVSPEELVAIALKYRSKGNTGVAFTYNEPLISYEYVIDTSKLLKEYDLKTILVTNGCVNADIADEVLPLVDALNIDLKAFRTETYTNTLKGDLDAVKSFIAKAVESCHVELTTLIVPGMNDDPEEIEEISSWIASLPGGEDIPLHISRFFPRYRMTDMKATDVGLIYELADIARKKLKYVYTGNC